jgi:SAM-dependent methyltransferase
MPDNYLPDVRDQYEALPYPPRDPQDDRKRLVQTWLEDLPMVNHYGFAGRQSFRDGFRALVAGGGTGDATIFLAEQLRALGAEDARVVHLDMSAASSAIARERAALRGLANIDWVHDSLLNLPVLAPTLGRFDYINCSGVLHHLADPDAGFRALESVLKDDGVIGLMVYAGIGRTGVYQMQQLMRLVNGDAADAPRKIANTKDILASLPPTNWFMRSSDLHHDHKLGDAGLYDLLLHSQDRAYTVAELFDWLGDGPGGHGYHLAFTDVQRGRSPYLPHMVLGAKPPATLGAIRQMPLRRQYEIAELLGGSIITHSLYLTRGASRTAAYGDPEMVPFYFHEPLTGAVAEQVFSTNRGQPFRLNHQHAGVSMMVNPGKYGAKLLGLIDGKRSFGEIFELFRTGWHGKAAAPGNEALFADLAESYETLNALDRLLLRHGTVA